MQAVNNGHDVTEPYSTLGRKWRLIVADAKNRLSKEDIRRNMETVDELARKDVGFN